LHAIAAVQHFQRQVAAFIKLQARVVRRHMRVVNDDVVVDGPAQRHRPGVHVHQPLRPAVAPFQLDQREALLAVAVAVAAAATGVCGDVGTGVLLLAIHAYPSR